jgi:VanZ family protein
VKLLSRKYFALLAIAYSVFIFYITSIPFDADMANWPSLWPRAFSIWESVDSYIIRRDIFANTLLFGGLGILLKISFAPNERFHEIKVLGCILYGFLLSYFIEVLQELYPERVSSLLDIWVDTLACAAGVLAMWLLQASHFNRLLLKWMHWLLRKSPYFLAAMGLAIILIVGPLFQVHSSYLSTWEMVFLGLVYFLFGFISFLAFSSNKEGDFGNPFLKTLFFTVFVFVVAEMIRNESISMNLELHRMVGACLGLFLGISASFFITRYSHETGTLSSQKFFSLHVYQLIFFALLLIILLDWLRPFLFSWDPLFLKGKLRGGEWIPFHDYEKYFTLWVMKNAVRKIVFLLGVGGCFALWLWTYLKSVKVITLLTVCMTGLFALFLEVLQLPVVGREFALTDILYGGLAGLLGSVLVYVVRQAVLESENQNVALEIDAAEKNQ